MSHKRILCFVLILFCCGCRKSSDSEYVGTVSANSSVNVYDVHFSSTAIGKLLWYRAIIPNIEGAQRLPVLILLHGANSSPSDFMDRSAIARLAAENQLIVIVPDGEYSYYSNAEHKRSAKWEDAIAVDLMHDIAQRWPVLGGREHFGIAGLSMGGYGAVKIALKHPDLFAFAGTMSGALDITRRPASFTRWGQTWRTWSIFGFTKANRQTEDVFRLLDRYQNRTRIDWFSSCGEKDPLLPVNQRFVRSGREHGLKIDSMITSGGHDWQSWNEAMPRLFKAASEALR